MLTIIIVVALALLCASCPAVDTRRRDSAGRLIGSHRGMAGNWGRMDMHAPINEHRLNRAAAHRAARLMEQDEEVSLSQAKVGAVWGKTLTGAGVTVHRPEEVMYADCAREYERSRTR